MYLSINQAILVQKNVKYTFLFCRSISLNLWDTDLNKEMKHNMEKYWLHKFGQKDFFDKKSSKRKRYILSMFPYPSGKLHMGHVRVYTIADTLGHFHRMCGENVFHPIGWDAFGLPAENAAVEHNIHPDEWTMQNIEQMKNQLKGLSFSFDWNHEIVTCSPNYYKWTQYILLKLFEKGLLYRRQAVVNWDPVDKTVLADEQIDETGCSWRSGAKAEKKFLKQWFIRTTAFAKDLYDGLNEDTLINWRDIIDLQKNWIGKCDGYSFDFKVYDEDNKELTETTLNIWTSCPENLPLGRFIIVSPGSIWDILSDGIPGTERKLNITAMNPFRHFSMPIYVSDKVSFSAGRDTYLGIPSVFPQDKELIYGLGEVGIYVNEGDTYTSVEVCRIAQELNFGGYAVGSKLKDWLVSRQRYWGTPIPLVHCSLCGVQPVPYEDLPVILPTIPESEKNFKGTEILKNSSEWLHTKCPKCNGNALRETDTLDTFVDSSWYYLRYLDPHNENEPFDHSLANSMMPVDVYVGGKEHAILHLYYARFMFYFLNSIGWIQHREPFTRLVTQGMVMGKTYRSLSGQYLRPDQIFIKGKNVIEKETGKKVEVSWEKMSKSKFNGIDPHDVLSEYGIDTTRLIILFSVAPFSHRHWNSDLFSDVLVWQHRLWLTIKEFLSVRNNELYGLQPFEDEFEEERDLWETRNYNVNAVTYKYRVSHQLAALITDLQQITTSLRKSSRPVRKYSKEYQKLLAVQIIMLAPIAPHFSATLWYGFTAVPGRLHCDNDELAWDSDVLRQKWPEIDNDYRLSLLCNAKKKHVLTIFDLKRNINILNMHSVIPHIVQYLKVKHNTTDINASDCVIDAVLT